MIPQTTEQKIAKLISKFRIKAKRKSHNFGIFKLNISKTNINLTCNFVDLENFLEKARSPKSIS